jgi:hypothetical protein
MQATTGDIANTSDPASYDNAVTVLFVVPFIPLLNSK